jgi:very-short-patch-repair endonuclease
VTAHLASSHQGAVKRAELLSAGVSRHVVDRRARDGDLHRVHRGVYLVGHEAQAQLAAEHAALLACGEHALISHRSAAHLWGMIEERPEDVEVTLVGRRCRRKSGVRIHSVARIDPRDVGQRGGVSLTSPARTLVDVASQAGEEETARAVAQARVKGLLRDADLQGALERSRGRPGAQTIRALLRREREPALTRSEAELRLRQLIGAARLPLPGSNARVSGYEVDLLWAAQRLVVEVDGFRFHGHRAAFERDRRRDATLVAAGYRVIRVTWRQITEEPLAMVASLGQALGPRA